jgi:hypothetical protein
MRKGYFLKTHNEITPTFNNLLEDTTFRKELLTGIEESSLLNSTLVMQICLV